jgi:hypothetical protein
MFRQNICVSFCHCCAAGGVCFSWTGYSFRRVFIIPAWHYSPHVY